MLRPMKLSQWAKKRGLSYRTAWNLFKSGNLPGERLPTGTILVRDIEEQPRLVTAVYVRVSSSQNKGNLAAQAARVSSFCSAKGWTVGKVVTECASGLNDSRPKLAALLKDPAVGRIVVEHKDRLTRFGFAYLTLLYPGEIVVINEVVESEEDLMQDFVSLVTSFCARLYGRRRSRRKTILILDKLNSTPE